MKVCELIARLQKFDPLWRVVTPGFDELLCDDAETVEACSVVFTNGPTGHSDPAFGESVEPNAVLISF